MEDTCESRESDNQWEARIVQMASWHKEPLGNILVSQGVISEAQLKDMLAEQKRSFTKLGEVLIDSGLATEEQITHARAMQMEVPYVNLAETEYSREILALVPQSVARDYKLIPLRRDDGKLYVAMADPMDIEAIDMLQYETKLRIDVCLGTESKIIEAIDSQYGGEVKADFAQFMDEATSSFDPSVALTDEDGIEDIDDMRRQSDTAPVIRIVNLILSDAVRNKASDVHVEPRRDRLDVRYRIDGELYLQRSVPKPLQAAVISRIKIMSDLDISERRLPQDGRISSIIDGKSVDFRVSTAPTLYGERVVLRILHRSQGTIPLDKLGFSPHDLSTFESLITQPYGIILVTGPTGSGKTTTLYAALNSLKSERTNIMTVEDPIEYELEGISQSNINAKIGFTFATQLRALLRQDPDIILVGEIRDSETADVAFRAAMTGHLVLSTLHANDAPSSISRLIDMGVEPFLVSSAIIGVTAQRLVRRLCQFCKEPYELDPDDKLILGIGDQDKVIAYKAVGCRKCAGRGYSGRLTIVELMVMSEEIRRLALNKSPSGDIKEASNRAGMVSMILDGTQKVLQGLTTVDELKRKAFVEAAATELPAACE
jgi:type IV pilus assembly protein PilB